MIHLSPSRRMFLSGIGAVGFGFTMPALANSQPLIQVVKDPNCGCCSAWIDVMMAEGFAVETREASPADLAQLKQQSGISAKMAACHTARVEGYVIEGHVPAADIRRLLAEKPQALGLAVPAMPWGAPGMGPQNERDAFSVFLIHAGGSAEVFTRYDAA